ncbi:MAG: hypothetical protein JW881_17070 [Spirochaetales bacterium]|nr:hypothetical protein [Spirochaetales bacterium]
MIKPNQYAIKRIFPAIFICIGILTATKAAAIETELSIRIENNLVLASVGLKGIDREELLASLKEGLTAEIFFQIRLYRKNKGLFSLLGDWLLLEKKPSYTAYKKFFPDEYVIETSEGDTYSYHEEESFIRNFCLLRDYRFTTTEDINLTDCYILARISINPVKLEPPLHLIVIISSIGRTTSWIEWHPEKEEQKQ